MFFSIELVFVQLLSFKQSVLQSPITSIFPASAWSRKSLPAMKGGEIKHCKFQLSADPGDYENCHGENPGLRWKPSKPILSTTNPTATLGSLLTVAKCNSGDIHKTEPQPALLLSWEGQGRFSQPQTMLWCLPESNISTSLHEPTLHLCCLHEFCVGKGKPCSVVMLTIQQGRSAASHHLGLWERVVGTKLKGRKKALKLPIPPPLKTHPLN